ncbi:MAG TPA: hypothetical protein VEK84_04080, partial [Terriglobales bacterium]|nr:hypothetical protein [Terriglobales bacterium]
VWNWAITHLDDGCEPMDASIVYIRVRNEPYNIVMKKEIANLLRPSLKTDNENRELLSYSTVTDFARFRG